MAPTPAISVIMPVADVAPWVAAAIESVLAQEVDLELIVAVDRSTDGTAERVARIAEQDPRIQAFSSDGIGGGEARNLAIERARGRYLAFADGDDLLPSGAYRAMLGQLEESGSPMVVGDHLTFRPTEIRRRGEGLPIYRRRSGIRLADEPRFLRDRTAWNRLVAREEWTRLGVRFANTRRANDIAAMVRLYCSLEFDVIEEPVYYYRWRLGAGSMTAQRHGAAPYADYIAEETRCADLVAGYGDVGVSAHYADYLLGLDIGNHLVPRLAAIQRSEEPADPAEFTATVELAERLLATVPPPVGQPRFAVVALTMAGRLRSAALLAAALAEEAAPASPTADPVALESLADDLAGTEVLSPADRDAAMRAVAASLPGGDDTASRRSPLDRLRDRARWLLGGEH